MKRLVCSLFAVAFALSFNACEQQEVDKLPPHYQHEIHPGGHPEGETKVHDEKHPAAPEHPEAKPAEAHK